MTTNQVEKINMTPGVGLVGRRVSYQITDQTTVGGTIMAVHNHLGKRRLYVKWDDLERDSFVHEEHPLLTIQD